MPTTEEKMEQLEKRLALAEEGARNSHSQLIQAQRDAKRTRTIAVVACLLPLLIVVILMLLMRMVPVYFGEVVAKNIVVVDERGVRRIEMQTNQDLAAFDLRTEDGRTQVQFRATKAQNFLGVASRAKEADASSGLAILSMESNTALSLHHVESKADADKLAGYLSLDSRADSTVLTLHGKGTALAKFECQGLARSEDNSGCSLKAESGLFHYSQLDSQTGLELRDGEQQAWLRTEIDHTSLVLDGKVSSIGALVGNRDPFPVFYGKNQKGELWGLAKVPALLGKRDGSK
jgi:hypothetical protein